MKRDDETLFDLNEMKNIIHKHGRHARQKETDRNGKCSSLVCPLMLKHVPIYVCVCVFVCLEHINNHTLSCASKTID